MALKFKTLDRLTIRKLQPGQRLAEHGITFERLPNGDGRYTVNIMVDGQRVHRVIGKGSDGVTRQQAEDFIEKARTDARQGRLNLPKGRKMVLGFGKAAAGYLVKLEQEGGKNIGKKSQHLRDHLAPFFGDKPLSKVSTFDVERYKKERLEAGITPGTLNRELATLSHLFTKAVEWRWIEHKPAVIKRLKEDKGRITYLVADQAAHLLEAAKHDQCWQVYPFIAIALETAMRRMEILSIRLEHIDLRKQVIYIPQAKAGAREQPITEHLAGFLKGYVDAAEPGQVWLFSASSASGHTVSIEKAFRRVVAAAGLDPKEVVRHTLRHTAITHLVQAGVDLPTVQRISGHKTLQMVVRYSHQSGEHIRAAMTKLERRYRP
ncbi:MAG: tyrosine-type recombinase/integrase [Gammaproteobacteria bacterium]